MVDDRALQLLRGPVERRRIAAFARQKQRAEARKIVFGDEASFGILLADRAERGGCREQRFHAVAFDCAPIDAGIRRADRFALEEHRRAAGQQRRVADVGMAHDPADVGCGPENLARLHVVDRLHRIMEGHRMPAIVADHALGRAGGSRGVEDVERVGREHGHAIGRRCGRDRLVPVAVAARHEAAGELRALQDEAGGGLVLGDRDRGVEQRLVGHHFGALDAARGRKNGLRRAIVDAHGEFVCGKAAEHDRMHRPQPRAGEHRDERFGHHRHVDDDAVAFGDARRFEGPRQSRDFPLHLGIGEARDRAGDGAVVDHGKALPVAGGDMAVDRVPARIELAARKPARDRLGVCVEHAGRRADPIDALGDLAPEPLRIEPGTAVDFRVARHRSRPPRAFARVLVRRLEHCPERKPLGRAGAAAENKVRHSAAGGARKQGFCPHFCGLAVGSRPSAARAAQGRMRS